MKILFLPDYPDREFYTIVAIFMRLGYFATSDPESPFDFAFSWQDSTWLEPNPVLEQVALQKPVLNLGCRDISKRRVEAVFSRVFGYSTFIDPTTGTGPMVQKYDENASGGFIVERPLAETDPELIYQKLLDSSRGNAMVEYRVPVVPGSIPMVYTELKDIPTDHIKTTKQSIEIGEVADVFSLEELRMITEFCSQMGLDFGELDIIRANDDHKIYILDANKTPGGFGMFNHVNWTHEQRSQAIERLAAAFHTGIQKLLEHHRSTQTLA